MPNIRTMFPSKRTEPEDFHELFPGGTVLTIDRVEDRRNQDEESYYVIYFNELAKPISLNKTNSRMISDLVGSDETEEWTGFQVRVMCIPIEVPGEGGAKQMKLGFRIFKKAPSAKPELTHKSDLSILLATKRQAERRLAASGDQRPLPDSTGGGIGIDRAITMMRLLKERGKNWEFVKAHFEGLGMAQQMAKIAKPPDLTPSMAAIVGSLIKSFPATVRVDPVEHEQECRALWIPSVSGEVIDKTTGEVISADDIPF